ncbi:flavodoxin family protein [Ignisphaera sp. 4213-co]|uniref:Flavodoxin family protein n=1 Tax=Ignisphaera cupida TaxID=3050454 RepID=A0ABD4Z742_9CREN|nr:flavodoxin family protein [Ignisphaera sp. 4213-co]MDK6029054.1 flavodoxin family protein [Ignisphaera sp. 4213-co]
MKSDTTILVVSASPRRYGNARLVAEGVRRIAIEIENVEAIKIDVYDYDIKPCKGCVSDDVKLCKLPCVIEDDMRKLYNLVEESDGIIFITPVYWYNVPGPLKNFIDRLTVFENAIFIEGRSRLEGKVAGFIAIGNDTGALAVIQNLMAILNSMGVAIPPWALAYHESEDDPTENKSFILDVANVVRGVVLLIKALKGSEKVTYWYRTDEEYQKKVLNIFKNVSEEFKKLKQHTNT